MKPACARCGHPHGVHEHHNAGTYCGICGRDGCRAYRQPRWWQRAAKPPVPPASPLPPAPGHPARHGGIAYTVRTWRCGRVRVWDADGTLTWSEDCTCSRDWDRALQRLTDDLRDAP